MSFEATVLRVLIASPGDVVQERAAVERALHGWNSARAHKAGHVLLPRMWENAVPELGSDAQSVINSQLVDDADIVVAFFDSRLGLITPRAVSGTAEEILRAHAAGKRVHVWFSTEPLPRSVDTDQLNSLREFESSLQAQGLLGSYAGPDDLAYQVREAIEQDIPEPIGSTAIFAPSVALPHPMLRAHLRRDSNSTYSIVITNTGTAPADELTVVLETSGGEEEASLEGSQGISLLDGATYAWQTYMTFDTGMPQAVHMSWVENGEHQELTQAVSL